jgi:hypothetical protein
MLATWTCEHKAKNLHGAEWTFQHCCAAGKPAAAHAVQLEKHPAVGSCWCWNDMDLVQHCIAMSSAQRSQGC